MRFLYAITAFLIGLVLLGLGIGQLTAWAPEETHTVYAEDAPDAPFTVVTEDLIDFEEEREDFTLEADGEYTLALGRTHDIEAWLGDASYNQITGLVDSADPEEGSHIAVEHIEGETEAPNPIDSDLWVDTETREGDLLYRWNTPDDSGDWALLIFRDGQEAAPGTLFVEQTAPVSRAGGIGLIVAGGLVLLLSLVLSYWAVATPRPRKLSAALIEPSPSAEVSESDVINTEAHEAQSEDKHSTGMEASAGEKQNTGDQQGLEAEHSTEEDLNVEEEHSVQDEYSAAKGSKGWKTRFGRGSAFIGLPVLTIALSATGGIATPVQATEESESLDDDSVSEQAEIDEGTVSEGSSVLLSSQLDRILQDVADVVATADEEQDAELLEERVAGHALEVRELSYRNHDLADASLPAPIGTEVLSAVVTSETQFPRQALVITDHPENDVPQILLLEQTAARENYTLIHTSFMDPGAEFPAFSAEQGGVEPVPVDDSDAEHSPEAAVRGVSRYFTDGDHEFGERMAQSSYIEGLHDYFSELQEATEDAEVNFPEADIGEDITALRLPDGSTVVAGSFDVVIQMSPLEDGDTIFLEHVLVEELVGTDWTTFPAEITSLESVVLQIPADDDGEIVLLGIHDIVSDASIDTPEWFDGYDED